LKNVVTGTPATGSEQQNCLQGSGARLDRQVMTITAIKAIRLLLAPESGALAEKQKQQASSTLFVRIRHPGELRLPFVVLTASATAFIIRRSTLEHAHDLAGRSRDAAIERFQSNSAREFRKIAGKPRYFHANEATCRKS
jgi:hypothetical protein